MEKKTARKILKIILIVIAIAIIVLLIHTIRNFVIVSNLRERVSEYTNSTNYHITSVVDQENGVIATMNYYRKGNKQAYFLERNDSGEISKLSAYDNGKRVNVFNEINNSKIANLNLDRNSASISIEIYDYLQNDNTWQTIIASMIAQIKSVEYNRKDTYIINNFPSYYLWFGMGKSTEVYIDKDTGLMVRNNLDDVITERVYEFNNVDDSIFNEPDISEYEIKK